jgi:ribonuclease HI
LKILKCTGSASTSSGIRKIDVELINSNKNVARISKPVGNGTSSEAKYIALIEGLKRALKLGWKYVHVQGDRLVIYHINSKWDLNAENLFELYWESIELLSQFDDVKIEWIPKKRKVKK